MLYDREREREREEMLDGGWVIPCLLACSLTLFFHYFLRLTVTPKNVMDKRLRCVVVWNVPKTYGMHKSISLGMYHSTIRIDGITHISCSHAHHRHSLISSSLIIIIKLRATNFVILGDFGIGCLYPYCRKIPGHLWTLQSQYVSFRSSDGSSTPHDAGPDGRSRQRRATNRTSHPPAAGALRLL